MVSQKLIYDNFNLGTWVSTQRISRKNNKLDLEKIKKLDSLPRWVWRVKSEK